MLLVPSFSKKTLPLTSIPFLAPFEINDNAAGMMDATRAQAEDKMRQNH
ncbi:hypothetical protein CGLO_16240 [Colletotrichum gloeosporioides Cg-14]|uniref:Uncharacterized protein n=1 Tax=Colletotrichum gloeosporioides (strain Cg-14) TaxID=1237896 RepID=T0L0C4_COLGC|nr:hypothetical protein CGLO_16240 [Colletotrichum gloeosporioides Cg-14]